MAVMSIGTKGTLMPFSARKIRMRRGLGARPPSYSFIRVLPLNHGSIVRIGQSGPAHDWVAVAALPAPAHAPCANLAAYQIFPTTDLFCLFELAVLHHDNRHKR